MTLFSLAAEGTKVLEQAGIPDAKHDATQLLLAAFHLDMTHYLLERMRELPGEAKSGPEMADYREMLGRRAGRVPLQQILGVQEFMGLEFQVSPHVLIPRQDTETLVELVLREQAGGDLLDLCTGSGCIAISLAVKGAFASVTATDLSGEALQVARRNADRLCPGRLAFFQGDLFQALAGASAEESRRYDVITANPPYIPTGVIRTLQPEVRDHEPRMALDGTADGVYYYRRIAADAENYLKKDGALYLEIGHDQGEQVRELLDAQGYRDIRVVRDLAGRDRVVAAVRPAGARPDRS